MGAWPQKPPGAPDACRRLAPAYSSFRFHLHSVFRSRWPHLIFGPLTALAVGGRPRGFWLLLAWGQARGGGRRSWADERWLITLPLGWLDPAAQRPSYLHGRGLPGAKVDTPDRMPLMDQTWLSSEFGASLLLATPRRNIWNIPAPLARHVQDYALIRAKRVARALLLLFALSRTYRTVGSPTLLPVVNP